MTVRVNNLSQQPVTIPLYHKYYCNNGAPCNCKSAKLLRSSQSDSRTGVFMVDKLLSESVTIAPGGVVKGLHEAIDKLPYVQDLLKTRPPTIRITKMVEKVVKVENKNIVPTELAPADAPVLKSQDKVEPRSLKRKKKARSTKKEKLNG